jgi:hypothetical protein
LALGPQTGGGAKSPYTLAIRLQTDRPDYVVGQPVRVRFVITTETTLSYPSTYVPDLEIVDSQNKRVRQTSPVDDPSRLVGRLRMGQLSPGNTTLQLYGWHYARVFRQWFTLGYLGYHLHRPSKYTILADGNLGDYNVIASPPVTFQILTAAMARARPPDMLRDPRTNAVFRSLANEYISLRSALAIGHIPEMYNNWDQRREDLQNRVDRLPSSGNPRSPYVQVNANLENAVEALGAAEERAFQCDDPNEKANLAVSDYFLGAVRRELATGEANVGDADNPPPYASPSGYCKGGMPTSTCPKPFAEVRYLAGPAPILPRGLRFKGTLIAFVEVGPNGRPVSARLMKTSGNAQVDQSVLEAAQHGKYSPRVLGCAAADGDYFFSVTFPLSTKPR